MTNQEDAEKSTAWERQRNLSKVVLSLGLALLGLWIISGLLAALIWAVVIAIAIDPLYLKAERGGLGQQHRNLLAALITLAIALLLVVPIAIGIAQAAREVSAVLTWIADAQRNGIAVPAWVHQLPVASQAVERWWQANLATPEAATLQLHHINMTNWLAHSRLIGAGLLHRLVIFAFTLIALFFLLRDRDSVVAQCEIAGDRLLGFAGERIVRQAVLSVRGTIDGLVLVGIGEGAVMTAAYIGLGVPHPLLLGALTAVAAMIPFGAAVLFVIAAFLLLIQSAPLAAIAVIILGLVVVGVADHFIRPALIGSATRLPFLWVLVGILGGVESFGLLGLFVGPATMAVLYMLWREFLDDDPVVPHRDSSDAQNA